MLWFICFTVVVVVTLSCLQVLWDTPRSMVEWFLWSNMDMDVSIRFNQSREYKEVFSEFLGKLPGA